MLVAAPKIEQIIKVVTELKFMKDLNMQVVYETYPLVFKKGDFTVKESSLKTDEKLSMQELKMQGMRERITKLEKIVSILCKK